MEEGGGGGRLEEKDVEEGRKLLVLALNFCPPALAHAWNAGLSSFSFPLSLSLPPFMLCALAFCVMRENKWTPYLARSLCTSRAAFLLLPPAPLSLHCNVKCFPPLWYNALPSECVK